MILKIIAYILLAVISFAALAANIVFIRTFATDELTAAIFICIAVFTFGAKTYLPARLPFASRVWNFLTVILVMACVAFDVFCGFGYASMTRGAVTGEKTAAVKAATDLQSEVSRLRARADELKATRPTGEVAGDLKAQQAKAGNCGPNGDPNGAACRKLFTLEGEHARATDRDTREAELKAAAEKLRAIVVPVSVDPQAEAADSMAKKLGIDGGGEKLKFIFSALIVVITELGPPILTYAAIHGPPIPLRSPARDAPQPAPAPATGALPRSRQRRASSTADDVLARLGAIARGEVKAPGLVVSAGRVEGSQRALGEACGVSAAKMNGYLKQLGGNGVVVTSGPNGTSVELST